MYYLLLCFTSTKHIDCIISKDIKLAVSHLFFRNQDQLPITPEKFRELCNDRFLERNQFRCDIICQNNIFKIRELFKDLNLNSNNIINKYLQFPKKEIVNYSEWHDKYYQQNHNIYLVNCVLSDDDIPIQKIGIHYKGTPSKFGNILRLSFKLFNKDGILHSFGYICHYTDHYTVRNILVISVYYPLFGRIYPMLISTEINEFL